MKSMLGDKIPRKDLREYLLPKKFQSYQNYTIEIEELSRLKFLEEEISTKITPTSTLGDTSLGSVINGGYVTCLALSEIELDYIPETIFDFPYLKALTLWRNNIKEIPIQLKNNQHIEYLNLSWNSLSEIPDWITTLKNLHTIKLTGNKITYIPKDIAKLKKLEVLKLSFNNIENLPTSLSELKELKELSLSNNKLKNVNVVKNLTELKILKLGMNKLEEFPTEIFNLKDNLEYLSLGGNNLQKIPDWIFELQNLSVLKITRSNLVNIPKSLTKMKNLEEIHLSGNKFKKIPEWVWDLPALMRSTRCPECHNFFEEDGKKYICKTCNYSVFELPPVIYGYQSNTMDTCPLCKEKCSKSDNRGEFNYYCSNPSCTNYIKGKIPPKRCNRCGSKWEAVTESYIHCKNCNQQWFFKSK